MDRESGRTPRRCRDAPHPPPYRASTSETELLFDSKQMQPEQSLCFGLRRYSHQPVSGAIQQVQAVSHDMLEPANRRFEHDSSDQWITVTRGRVGRSENPGGAGRLLDRDGLI